MRYVFVFLAIVVIWWAVVMLATVAPNGAHLGLYLSAQALTLALFAIGFYRR